MAGEQFFVYKALKFLGFKNIKSNLALSVDASIKLLNQLTKFDSNDWENIVDDIIRSPFKANEEIKFNFKLFAHAVTLRDYFDAVLKQNSGKFTDIQYLRDLRQKYIPNRTSDSEWIATLITARNAARAAKNWAESDRIRDELAAQGVTLKDNRDGTTTWEVKR